MVYVEQAIDIISYNVHKCSFNSITYDCITILIFFRIVMRPHLADVRYELNMPNAMYNVNTVIVFQINFSMKLSVSMENQILTESAEKIPNIKQLSVMKKNNNHF